MAATKKVTTTSEMLPCVCAHAFQDQHYGRGLRLHTICHYSSGKEARCTVCKPNRLMRYPGDIPDGMFMPSIRAIVRKDEQGRIEVHIPA